MSNEKKLYILAFLLGADTPLLILSYIKRNIPSFLGGLLISIAIISYIRDIKKEIKENNLNKFK
ncbi:TPA: hypothetical protein ACXDAZ_002644 [Clostridium botulinum]